MPAAVRKIGKSKVGKRARVAAQRDVPRIGLGLLLREADMAFNRALRDELSKHRITFSQYQHLRHLWQSDGLAQVELSHRIGIETASSTAVLNQLDKRALIRRQRDPRDRRRIIVTLTPAGRALERPLENCAIVVNMRARAKLSRAKVAALFDMMKTIIGNVRPPGNRKNNSSRPGRISGGHRGRQQLSG